uniref:Uncharacterized protein n=1 Tax=Rhizophora mucronata TaxID=61149 RepID=A0A2P2JN91_RHIMU
MKSCWMWLPNAMDIMHMIWYISALNWNASMLSFFLSCACPRG